MRRGTAGTERDAPHLVRAESESPGPRPPHLFARVLPALALAALGLLLPLFGLRTALVLYREAVFPGDNCFPECAIVQGIVWAAHGEPVYRSLRGWDVPTMLYGPLTYFIPAWAGRLTGANSAEGLRTIARGWSLLGFAGAGFLLAEITATMRRRAGRTPSILWPALAAMAFWVFTPIPVLAVTARCDAPFLLLNLLTIRLLMRYDERTDVPWIGLAMLGGMILLSAAVRQVVLGPPATVVLWLLARRRWGKAAAFCVAVPAVALGLLALGDRMAGGHVIENILDAGAVEYRLTSLRTNFERILAYLLLLFVPAVCWSVQAWRKGRVPAMSLFPVASFPFAFLLAAKKGSSPAYYWETLMASAPAFALMMEEFLPRLGRAALGMLDEISGSAADAALAAMLLLASLELGAVAGNDLVGMIREPRPTREDVATEIRAIESFGDAVYGLPLRWSILATRRPFVSSDLFQHDLIVTAGQIGWEPVTRELAARRFPVLAVDPAVFAWPELSAVREALQANYERTADPVAGLRALSFWRPRPGP